MCNKSQNPDKLGADSLNHRFAGWGSTLKTPDMLEGATPPIEEQLGFNSENP